MSTRRALGGLGRVVRWGLRPNQRLRWTREGGGYILVWLALLGTGLYQQLNLVLLVAGLAAGPIAGSIFVSAAMLRGLRAARRRPPYVFAGDDLAIDYTLENDRRFSDALALGLADGLSPVDRSVPGAADLAPSLFFARVPARGSSRLRWSGTAPGRGRYRFGAIELRTRAPFGLLERVVTLDRPAELVVYPRVGRLTRRWRLIHREATETRRGRRRDRSLQQMEYHGLRDYRAGDSPRWIHWRTTARLGQPMVKEFEEQHEQDLAILLDPWQPRTQATPRQREAVEEVVRFAATVCLETCRTHGRRLLLGWTGPTPGLRHGPASVKLLHELLEQLALLRPAPEGGLAALLDALPPQVLRESLLVVVSTRPIQLAEELERSRRLADGAGTRLAGKILKFDASRGDLADLVDYGDAPTAAIGRVGPEVEADAVEVGDSTAGPPP